MESYSTDTVEKKINSSCGGLHSQEWLCDMIVLMVAMATHGNMAQDQVYN